MYALIQGYKFNQSDSEEVDYRRSNHPHLGLWQRNAQTETDHGGLGVAPDVRQRWGITQPAPTRASGLTASKIQ